ncbi:MAG: hypothetical protein NVSMB39_6370 [Candidatus Saccharimonadales bacterium]
MSTHGKSSMRKIKPQNQPNITFVLGAFMIAQSFLAATPAPHVAPPAAPVAPITQANGVQTPAHPTTKAPVSAAFTTPKSVPAHLSVPTVPSSVAIKYPGLPTYPHPQYQYHTLALPAGHLYPMEPFLKRISAPAGWDAAANTNPVPTIAVIDTGFALSHEDLTGRWALNPGETQGGTTDADSDGYIGNWRGWDFVHNSATPMAGTDSPTGSAVAHGTHTAALAGLLNPNAKILPLQALADDGTGYTDSVAAAVRYAADHGAKIISLSLGSASDDPYLHQQIDYAISRGAVVVAAAGNDGCDCMLYPAAYPEVLSVGATTSTDTPASFSSYGAQLDVMAPGTSGDFCSDDFSSSNATNGYGCSYAGTSFATPITAGLAALLVQKCPGCTNVDIITAIELGADQLASANYAVHTNSTGYGRINVARAVTLITTPAAVPLGQLVSKHSLSLSAVSLHSGPQMDSTCSGLPGATCTLYLQGPAGQNITGGTLTLDYQYGGGAFNWNAANLGLTPGTWKILTTITANGTSATTLADIITVFP